MSEFLCLTRLACPDPRPDRVVALRRGTRLARTDFLAGVGAWQRAWQAVEGSDVALYFEDPFDFACALYGAWHCGKRVWLPGDRQPDTVERLMPHVHACAGDLPGAVHPVQGAAAGSRSPLPPDCALAVFTSGSTGAPTAIHKRLWQLDAEVRNLETAFGAALGDATVHATVSHQHIYGLLFHVLWPLAAGRAFNCHRLRYPEQIAALAPVHAALLVASPAHLRRLPELLDWSGARTALRGVFSSGGALSGEAARQVAALLGTHPTEVYGSSETGGVAWRRQAGHGEAWQSMPGVEWRIEHGLLALRSPHLPDRNWSLTQDRAEPDGGGGFVLLGRADRIAKIEERRISLSQIERLLVALPEIDEARAFVLAAPAGARVAVVAVPTALGWQRLALEGRTAFHARLRSALAPALEHAALPRRFRLVSGLPADHQGKVTEALLAALFMPRAG